jgi:uncharacterized protein YukE
VLPSRSRLEGWNPDSLTSAAAGISSGGESVAQAVDTINNNIKIMPETKAWDGSAHDAATGMFDRAHKTTTAFSDYTTAIGNALSEGAGWIGNTRMALLNKADEIDSGELHVSDHWVVLIKPAAMSAEKVAELMERVKVEQGIVNGLLLAVGEADDGTAAKVTAAAQPFGFVPPSPDGLGGMMVPGVTKPADEVPNPRDHIGLFQQATIRGEDMGMIVRETSERYNKDGNFEKTLIMQDGSKHVITEYEYDYARGVPDMVTDEHWDSNGNWISKTSSSRTPMGYHQTIINWADGTQFVGTETPDGVRTAAFTLPDGRHGVLPPDNPFFTGPFPAIAGGTLTGLEAHIDRGGRLPMVSMDAAEKIGAGAKFGGPALGILTTIYDMGVAETPYDRCVAGVAGGFGIVGDWAGGAGGAVAGTVAPPSWQVYTVPAAAVGGSVLVGDWMKDLGAKVGAAFCK